MVTLLMVCLTGSLSAQQSKPDNFKIIALPNAYGQVIDPTENVEKGLVLIFSNHKCLYAQLYLDRIKSLYDRVSDRGIKLVLVETKIGSLEKTSASLDQYLKENGISFSYLIDIDNALAKSLGAESSPHAFLLRKEADRFELVYDGSIDNNSRKPERVTRAYLENAVDQMLENKEIKYPKSKAVGCDISTN